MTGCSSVRGQAVRAGWEQRCEPTLPGVGVGAGPGCDFLGAGPHQMLAARVQSAVGLDQRRIARAISGPAIANRRGRSHTGSVASGPRRGDAAISPHIAASRSQFAPPPARPPRCSPSSLPRLRPHPAGAGPGGRWAVGSLLRQRTTRRRRARAGRRRPRGAGRRSDVGGVGGAAALDQPHFGPGITRGELPDSRPRQLSIRVLLAARRAA